MRRRRCLNGISPYRARSAAATGGSAPGSIACARASLACSIANSIAGAEAAERLRLLWRERSEEHTSELQSQSNLVCRLLLEQKTTNEPYSWIAAELHPRERWLKTAPYHP